MTSEDYAKKIVERSSHYPWLNSKKILSKRELIKCRQEYLFTKDRKQ